MDKMKPSKWTKKILITCIRIGRLTGSKIFNISIHPFSCEVSCFVFFPPPGACHLLAPPHSMYPTNIPRCYFLMILSLELLYPCISSPDS